MFEIGEAKECEAAYSVFYDIHVNECLIARKRESIIVENG